MLRSVAALLALVAGCSPVAWLFVYDGPEEAGTITLGQTVSSSTSDAPDRTDLPCGEPAGGGEEAWTFVAPETGSYRVRVEARYDSVVAVREGDPEGDDLACNDDFGDEAISQVTVHLERGERYSILVDGFRDRRGGYRLEVTTVDPPAPTAASTVRGSDHVAALERRCAIAPVLAEGNARGTLSPELADAAVSCGRGGRGAEVIFRVDVSERSLLQVREHSDFDAILELREGCSRDHRVIACVDDAPDVRHTALTTNLEPGTYYLILDSLEPGTAGSFQLDVSLIPDTEQGSSLPVRQGAQ